MSKRGRPRRSSPRVGSPGGIRTRGSHPFATSGSKRTRGDHAGCFARRFLIPYIDLGMDVHKLERGYCVAGQAVLSSPGGPCLWCYGILTDERLAREAEDYGKAGSRPQVVWPNGVLASIGVGLLMQLGCPWPDKPLASPCREVDGTLHA